MLRNKLSFLLASSLCLAFVGCDDGDGDDTGAGTESGTTDATTTDTPTTDTPTTDTPTTDTPTTDTPTTDGETTDTPDTDTSDDSSTTDDSGDPCDDVVCEDGQSCVGGICVDDGGETDTAGETDTGAGECSAAVMFPAPACGECAEDSCCDGLTGCFGDINEITEPTACGLLNDCIGAQLGNPASEFKPCIAPATAADVQACADAACPDTAAETTVWLAMNQCIAMNCQAQCAG